MNWVPGSLQTAEMLYARFQHLMEPKISHHPTYYWQQHCYATFMTDPSGFRLLDQIGADRVMWSSDYPHLEGMFGTGWTAMQQVVDAVSEDDARKILGGTAIELFAL
jgi:predicted TIM-barrel fold metal-dependent hydrolase